MKLIAVIDMRGGYGVRASADRGRGGYPFLREPFPVRVVSLVSRLYHAYGFRHIYIADLDSLMGKKEAWAYHALYRTLEGSFSDVTFYVDGGFRTYGHVRHFYRLVKGRHIVPVICTECFCGMKDWREIKRLRRGRVVLSLDYRNEHLLGDTYIEKAVALWSPYVLVMALDAIGRGRGKGMERAYAIQERGRRYGSERHFKGCFVAGGVGCFQHILMAQEQGFAGVLLSSTLYGGVFSTTQLQNWNKSLLSRPPHSNLIQEDRGAKTGCEDRVRR